MNVTKSTIYLVLLIVFSGCKKFVEIGPPVSQLTTTNVFNNVATATSAQTNIYTQMLSNGESFFMSENNGLLADELQSYSNGYFPYYQNALTATGNFGPWTNAYKYIYAANANIEGLQNNTSIPAKSLNQLIGEAKFIRAFWFFYLTNIYGDVPLVTSTDYKKNSVMSRAPKAQVYQQIIADLSDAKGLLQDNYVDASDTTTSTERVRPNKSVAAALLARTYLYWGDYNNHDVSQYANAEAQATLVISNPLYSLIPLTTSTTNYPFFKNNTEAIWQLATTLPAVQNGSTFDGSIYILTAAPNSTNSISLSNFLLNSFEVNDNRKNIWVKSYTTTTTPQVTYYYPFKYKINTDNGSASNIQEYVMVMRLAEQYLIRAEARAQQGNLTGAASDLNVIRNRAGLPNYAGATDKASLLTAVLHERQVELFTEWGHRWFDLNRTGNTNAVMSIVTPAKGGVWSTDLHQTLYPIPESEILVDPNLKQNQGY